MAAVQPVPIKKLAKTLQVDPAIIKDVLNDCVASLPGTVAGKDMDTCVYIPKIHSLFLRKQALDTWETGLLPKSQLRHIGSPDQIQQFIEQHQVIQMHHYLVKPNWINDVLFDILQDLTTQGWYDLQTAHQVIDEQDWSLLVHLLRAKSSPKTSPRSSPKLIAMQLPDPKPPAQFELFSNKYLVSETMLEKIELRAEQCFEETLDRKRKDPSLTLSKKEVFFLSMSITVL